MIVTVTPNIALDITYTIDAFELYGSMRVNDVAERAGGKGINVSRVLHALGRDTRVLGFVGGVVGQAITADLTDSGIDFELVDIAGQTRRSVGIVDRSVGDATVLNEAGPTVSSQEWSRLIELVASHAVDSRVLVVSGSLPPGAAVEGAAQLAQIGADAGVPVVIDTSGGPLVAALDARPALIKPNIHEIRDVTGLEDPVDASMQMLERGAQAVAVSLGADGMAIITPDTRVRARPPEFIKGNPTGAGDAGVSALAAGIADQLPWDQCLRNAVALSAAAVAHPLAGSFDDDVYRRMLELTEVEEF